MVAHLGCLKIPNSVTTPVTTQGESLFLLEHFMNESLDQFHSFQKQPEALRLADILEDDHAQGQIHIPTGKHAAAELRRLHTELERLTDALRRANGMAEHFERHWYLRGDQIEELLAVAEDFSSAMNLLAMRQGLTVLEIARLLNPIGDKARAAIAKATGGAV